MGGWVGCRGSLDAKKREISYPFLEFNPDTSVVQHVS
jgi:hypothetical protein